MADPTATATNLGNGRVRVTVEFDEGAPPTNLAVSGWEGQDYPALLFLPITGDVGEASTADLMEAVDLAEILRLRQVKEDEGDRPSRLRRFLAESLSASYFGSVNAAGAVLVATKTPQQVAGILRAAVEAGRE